MRSQIIDKLRRLYNPPAFQGDLASESYFEGWYFKLVTADEGRRFALIPGVSLDRARGTSHAFLQTIDGDTAETQYHELPLEAFRAAEGELRFELGDSRFSSTSIELDIDDEQGRLEGSLELTGLSPWPRRLLAPGVMGWYSFVPFMECYHGLVSLDHGLRGALTINGERIDFTGGRGYTEKDWGTSFPSGYTWMQSNHFGRPRTCCMASIARVPWLGAHFTGYLVALLVEGELYRFTTYTGATLHDLDIGSDRVRFQLRDRRHRVELVATRSPRGEEAARDDVVLLRSPTMGEMKGRIGEALTAAIDVRLYRRQRRGRDRLLFEGRGTSAGLEIETTQEQMESTALTTNPTLQRLFLFKG
jgi:tocopherol cyclase